MSDLNPVFAGILDKLGRSIAKAHREAIKVTGHFRRTKAGALTWVEPHQVMAHVQEHGPEPDLPKNPSTSVWMGKEAMAEAIKGNNVVHAMHRTGIGWIDFLQGTPGDEPPLFEHGGGILHILAKRDYEHQQDPRSPNGLTTLRLLPEVIAKGKIISTRGLGKVEIELGGYRAVLNKLDPEKANPAEHWLLTGFKKGRPR